MELRTEVATEKQMRFAQAIVETVSAGRAEFDIGFAEAVSLLLCVAADLARGSYGPECLEAFSRVFIERRNFPLPPTMEELEALEAMAEAADAPKH